MAVRPTDDDDKPPAALWSLPAAGGEAVEVLAPPGGVEIGEDRARRFESGGARTAVCRRRAASTTTAGCGICARTTRSPRSCTPAIRSGTGTRISAPAPRICSHWTSADDRRAGRSHAAAGRSVARRRLRRQRRRPLRGDVVAAARAGRVPALRARSASTSRPANTPSSPTNPDADLWSPAISPDGSAVAFIRESYSTPVAAPRISLGYLRFGEDATGARRRLGSLAGVGDMVARRRCPDRHRRRRRSLPGVPNRHRRRRGRGADHRRLRLHRCEGRARRTSSTRCAAPTRRRRTRCASIPTAPSRRCRVSSCPRCPAHSPRSRRHATDGDRGAVVAGAARTRRCAGAASALDPRRAAGQLELLALAVEPVGARRARLRGAAAGPGAVDRATARTSSNEVGARGAVRRSTT